MGYIKMPLENAAGDKAGEITLNFSKAYSVKKNGSELRVRTTPVGAAGQVVGWAIRFTSTPTEQDALNLQKLIALASQEPRNILLFELEDDTSKVRQGGLEPSTIDDE
tara:strand:+ start:60 stop:383 length:324 start_codon:yes stop_codon:yes gene_type:complete